MEKHKHSLAINGILNVLKQCCVLIFPMITFPYASRVLGAENYGKINFGSSVVSYISLIAALGINNYAVREGAIIREDGKRFRKIADEIFTLNLCSTVFAYVLLVLLILFIPGSNKYGAIILLQSITILFTTLGTEWINIINEDQLYITIRYMLCQLFAIILMFCLVKEPEDYILYVCTSSSAAVSANVMNIVHIRKRAKISVRIVPLRRITSHVKPVLIMFGSALTSLVYINSDITILGILADDRTVGYYSVSVKIYSLIKQLLNAFMLVAIPRLSNELVSGDDKKAEMWWKYILNGLVLIVIPSMAGIFCLGKRLILVFAGTEYLPALPSLRILSIALIFATIACFYINVVMLPYGMEKDILIATGTSASVNIILNFLLIPDYGASAAAFTTVISEIIMVTFGIIKTYRKIKISVFKSLIISIIASVWVFAVVAACNKIFRQDIFILIIAILISILGAIGIYLIGYKKEIIRYIEKEQK